MSNVPNKDIPAVKMSDNSSKDNPDDLIQFSNQTFRLTDKLDSELKRLISQDFSRASYQDKFIRTLAFGMAYFTDLNDNNQKQDPNQPSNSHSNSRQQKKSNPHTENICKTHHDDLRRPTYCMKYFKDRGLQYDLENTEDTTHREDYMYSREYEAQKRWLDSVLCEASRKAMNDETVKSYVGRSTISKGVKVQLAPKIVLPVVFNARTLNKESMNNLSMNKESTDKENANNLSVDGEYMDNLSVDGECIGRSLSIIKEVFATHIMHHLSLNDLLSLGLVCKTLNDIVNKNTLRGLAIRIARNYGSLFYRNPTLQNTSQNILNIQLPSYPDMETLVISMLDKCIKISTDVFTRHSQKFNTENMEIMLAFDSGDALLSSNHEYLETCKIFIESRRLFCVKLRATDKKAKDKNPDRDNTIKNTSNTHGDGTYSYFNIALVLRREYKIFRNAVWMGDEEIVTKSIYAKDIQPTKIEAKIDIEKFEDFDEYFKGVYDKETIGPNRTRQNNVNQNESGMHGDGVDGNTTCENDVDENTNDGYESQMDEVSLSVNLYHNNPTESDSILTRLLEDVNFSHDCPEEKCIPVRNEDQTFLITFGDIMIISNKTKSKLLKLLAVPTDIPKDEITEKYQFRNLIFNDVAEFRHFNNQLKSLCYRPIALLADIAFGEAKYAFMDLWLGNPRDDINKDLLAKLPLADDKKLRFPAKDWLSEDMHGATCYNTNKEDHATHWQSLFIRRNT